MIFRGYAKISCIFLLESVPFFLDSSFKLVDTLIEKFPQALCRTEIGFALPADSIPHDVDDTSNLRVDSLTTVMCTMPRQIQEPVQIVGHLSGIMFTIYQESTGAEDGIEFLGSSFICDAKGNILTRAGEDDDEIVTAEIDVEEGRNVRHGLSFYRDRRPDIYGEIAGNGG